ncbi:MAG: hypothetical protein GXO60_08970 [Epsilonproteobacteria bacterium]|nr:hypothetical protein [Campylobacterota bacterium]
MRSKFLLLGSVALLFFTACSSRQYYTPKSITTTVSPSSTSEIASFNRDGATLENGMVLTRKGELKLKLKDGFKFVNGTSEGVVISNKDGDCTILRKGTSQEIKFPKELIAGTVIGDEIVYILKDNNFGIYDLNQKSIVYNNKAEKTFSIDTRVANPIRVENLVVIPLLSGKLVVLDLKGKKVLKEIVVSVENKLNNVIFLKQLKNTLIAATPYKVITVNNQGRREFEKAISEVATDNKSIFVFAKDGKISRLDLGLTVQDEKKFKFAHFSVSTVYKDRVYALDKQGYLIVSNKDFTKYKVYEVPEVDGYSFVSGRYIYYDGNRIDLEPLNYE